MMQWAEFALAMVVFLASHIIPTRPHLRTSLVAQFGSRGYGMAYGLLSLILLAWVILAAGRAPFVPLWDQTSGLRWLVNIMMPLAIGFASFAIGAVNPFSFGGRKTGFDRAHPGIAGVTRHPLLWSLLIWALAHLFVNGDLAHVLLFGGFAAFAVLGMRAIERRNQRLWGEAQWADLTEKTSLLPFAALITGRWRPVSGPSLIRLLIALGLWAAILHLHGPVIGVSPFP